MERIGIFWKGLYAAVRSRRVPLALGLRVAVAAVVALVAAQAVGLPLPLWAVLTAVIVTQMSVGMSPKASIDYLIGTLGGAAYGGAIALAIPHAGEAATLVVLVLAVAPLAVLAAIRPSRMVMPLTAVIVLLVPATAHGSPFDSAILRVLEVALGAVVGLLVSLLVLPISAQRLVRQEAAGALGLLAAALGDALAGVTHGLHRDVLSHLYDGVAGSLSRLRTVGVEAAHERSAHLSSAPDSAPLERTLYRLLTDLVIIGRTAGQPLPDMVTAGVGPALAEASAAVGSYLRDCGAALLTGKAPPPRRPVEHALGACGAAFAAARGTGWLRNLADVELERFFAIGFALEQLRDHLEDLDHEVADWGTAARPARVSAASQ